MVNDILMKFILFLILTELVRNVTETMGQPSGLEKLITGMVLGPAMQADIWKSINIYYSFFNYCCSHEFF